MSLPIQTQPTLNTYIEVSSNQNVKPKPVFAQSAVNDVDTRTLSNQQPPNIKAARATKRQKREFLFLDIEPVRIQFSDNFQDLTKVKSCKEIRLERHRKINQILADMNKSLNKLVYNKIMN